MILAQNSTGTEKIGIAPSQIRGFYAVRKSPDKQYIQPLNYQAAIEYANEVGIVHYLLAKPFEVACR